MSTEFYADYIKKTTFDPDTSSVRQKFTAVKADDVIIEIDVKEEEQLQEAATDTKKKPASKTPKVEVPATEIPEELHGDQDKLDHNKDKKISASDMKTVRKHGPVKEEEELEEGTFKVDVEGLPTMYIDGSSAGTIKAQMRKKFKDPKAVVNVERITSTEKKQELRAKMSEEDLNELDKKTMGSYVKKAVNDLDNRSFTQGMRDNNPNYTSADAKNNAKIRARRTGIDRAVNKMSEDQAAIDAYLKKGGKITKVPPAKAQGAHGDTSMASGVAGQLSKADTSRFKTQKKVKSMEDVEQVDEISNRAKGAYVRVAARDAAYQSAKGTSAIYNNDAKDSKRKEIQNADRIRNNRMQGIDRATRGMKNEGAMKRMATQDAEKERLGPKVKGTGLETFKKKPTNEEKDTHVTKDGHTAKKGLWYNIHKKRARGEAPAKPGDPDRPSAADLKRSQ